MTVRTKSRWSIGIAVDWFFLVFAGLAVVWLAYLSFTEAFTVRSAAAYARRKEKR